VLCDARRVTVQWHCHGGNCRIVRGARSVERAAQSRFEYIHFDGNVCMRKFPPPQQVGLTPPMGVTSSLH